MENGGKYLNFCYSYFSLCISLTPVGPSVLKCINMIPLDPPVLTCISLIPLDPLVFTNVAFFILSLQAHTLHSSRV